MDRRGHRPLPNKDSGTQEHFFLRTFSFCKEKVERKKGFLKIFAYLYFED
jgi:hypothetical protein